MNRLIFLFVAALPALTARTDARQNMESQNDDSEDFEAEFVASDVFRSGSLVFPVFRRFAIEGHYFGGKQVDTGFTGVSWAWSWKHLKLAPGVGVVFGSNQFTSSPAISFRWDYERRWFITQGLAVQSFRDTPIFAEETEDNANADKHSTHEPVGFVRPTISDGNHVSGRWRRVTVGGTWEHIAFREGSEWKGGGRLAIRFLPRVSAILYVLAPGHTEWRGGILIHGREDHPLRPAVALPNAGN